MDSIDITKIYNISTIPANEQAYTQLNASVPYNPLVFTLQMKDTP